MNSGLLLPTSRGCLQPRSDVGVSQNTVDVRASGVRALGILSTRPESSQKTKHWSLNTPYKELSTLKLTNTVEALRRKCRAGFLRNSPCGTNEFWWVERGAGLLISITRWPYTPCPLTRYMQTSSKHSFGLSISVLSLSNPEIDLRGF